MAEHIPGSVTMASGEFAAVCETLLSLSLSLAKLPDKISFIFIYAFY